MLALALCVSTTSAFLSPTARLATTVRKPFSCRVTLRNDGSPASHPGEDEGDDDQSSGWLSWMAQGRRKGVSEVKMRDPEELGGVPRSDRYSSRYVFRAMFVMMFLFGERARDIDAQEIGLFAMKENCQ